MNVRCIGVNTVHGEDYKVSGRKTDSDYMLILMKSGGSFDFGRGDVRAESDSVIIYDKNSVRNYGGDGGVFICDWICFDMEGDSDFLEALELPLETIIPFSEAELLSGIIRSIAADFYSAGSQRAKTMDSQLKMLLYKVKEACCPRGAVQQSADPHYTVLNELRERIYRNPQLKWSVDAMAADVNMSRSYFQHIYREIFGVSCISDVINGKIEKAKEILSETSCTVSQAAAMCGYDNEEHFMRQFKKLVGVTPTAYRKKS